MVYFNRNKVTRFFALAFVVLFFLPQIAFCAVTREAFLAALYDARGIEFTFPAEPTKKNAKPAPPRHPKTGAEKAEASLRMGFAGTPLTGITKVQASPVGKLNAPITRIEAVRYAVQSLGLSFEALALSGVKPPFADIGKISEFERGCITVAQKTVPQLWDETGANFAPTKPLEQSDMKKILQAVESASQGLLLELFVSPAKGISIRFHREGAFSGQPKWRVVVHGFDTQAAAKSAAAQLKMGLSVQTVNYDWKLRTELLDDWRKVEAAYSRMSKIGKIAAIVPAVVNIISENLPRFWLTISVPKNTFDFGVLLPPQGVSTLAPMTQMRRKKTEPLIAVNAGYFMWKAKDIGSPVGVLMADGELLNAPYLDRTVVAWSKNSAPIFEIMSQGRPEHVSFTDAIQAGPMILSHRIVYVADEGFEPGFVNGRHPRTAVGTDANGDWVFFVGDGRNGVHSVGFSLAETATIMRDSGASNALNLDGGGSTEILLRGKFFNFPSEGRERPISNAIGVFSRP